MCTLRYTRLICGKIACIKERFIEGTPGEGRRTSACNSRIKYPNKFKHLSRDLGFLFDCNLPVKERAAVCRLRDAPRALPLDPTTF